MNTFDPSNIPPALLPFLFVGMWCSISYLLSLFGDWRRLAKIYSAKDKPHGRCFSMQRGTVGFVNYGSCLKIYTTPQGFYLTVWPPFRLGHPPLFIPWDAVHNPTAERFLWFESVVFSVGSPTVATLQLPMRFFETRNDAVQSS
ncbi:MAG: hypothetical protein U1F65_09975 [Verrucomicrobiota bacterium]